MCALVQDDFIMALYGAAVALVVCLICVETELWFDYPIRTAIGALALMAVIIVATLAIAEVIFCGSLESSTH